jgi:hypothetical protein
MVAAQAPGLTATQPVPSTYNQLLSSQAKLKQNRMVDQPKVDVLYCRVHQPWADISMQPVPRLRTFDAHRCRTLSCAVYIYVDVDG